MSVYKFNQAQRQEFRPVEDSKEKEETASGWDVLNAAWDARRYAHGEHAAENTYRNLYKEEARAYTDILGSEYEKDFQRYLKEEDPVFSKTQLSDPYWDMLSFVTTGIKNPSANLDDISQKDMRSIIDAARDRFLDKQRMMYPALAEKLPKRTNLEKEIEKRSLEYAKKYVETTAAAPDDWGSYLADVAGTAGATLTEEVQVKSLIMSMATGGGSIAKTSLYEAFLGAGTELSTLPERAEYRAKIGDPITYLEATAETVGAGLIPATGVLIFGGAAKLLGIDKASRLNKVAQAFDELGDQDRKVITEMLSDDIATNGFDLARFSDDVTPEQAQSLFKAVQDALDNNKRYIDTTKIDLPDKVFKSIDISKVDDPAVKAMLNLAKRISESFDKPTKQAKVVLRKEEKELFESFFSEPEEILSKVDQPEKSIETKIKERENLYQSEDVDASRIDELNSNKKGMSKTKEKYMRQFMGEVAEDAGTGIIESADKELARTRKRLERLISCGINR